MIPKAELHVHLEGTAPPNLVRRLAARNKMTLPERLFGEDGRYLWDHFLHFLKVYDATSSVIRTPEDYRDVTYEYLASCAEEGVIYVEVSSSPDHAAANGMSYGDHVEGIVAGIEDARDQFGIEGRLIVTCVRHFGVERSMEVARQVVDEPHPLVTGFGMGGDEAGHPPGQFSRVFQYVADSGLPCTVHAGEWAGPDGIREAIETLPVTRLGHGIRVIEDRALLSEVISRGITLEVCPGSNLATGIYPDYASHPVADLIAAGAKVTLSSDDPPYFATSIGKEYDDAGTHLGMDADAQIAITRNAIEAAFVDEPTRAKLMTRLDDAANETG